MTRTALEAALKESDEIKVFDPPYNIALRLSDRGPVFSTGDLKQFCQKPDKHYRIGPLPSKKHIEPLSLIMDFLNGKISCITQEIINKTLATPEEYSPEPPLFLEGLKEFKKQNNNLGENPVTFRTLMKMGTTLWKENLGKQNNFDVFTYDRMRILTTEIRRILEDKRTVQIQLGPKLVLKSDQLNEILKWV